MQPDQQNNYWQKKPDGEDETRPTELYTPEQPDVDEPGAEIDPQPDGQPTNEEPVHWAAAEYIHEEKNNLWFIIFGVVAAGLIALDILFVKSYTFSALVVVMAAAIVVFTRRPPNEVQYTLSGDQGLYIGEKLYHYSDFKSFGYIRDREHNSIMLIPIKRFSPAVSVYFPEEVGEAIVDILGARLPMEELRLDIMDKIVRKLHI